MQGRGDYSVDRELPSSLRRYSSTVVGSSFIFLRMGEGLTRLSLLIIK